MSNWPVVQNGVAVGIMSNASLASRRAGQTSPALVEANFKTGTYFANGTPYTLGTLPGWTFTRASAGYASTVAGLYSSFAIDVARVTDQGLLIEAAATNSLLQSANLANAAWIKDQGGTGVSPVVTAGQADPAGGTTAFQLDFVKGSSFSRIHQNPVYATDGIWSVFLRASVAGPNIAQRQNGVNGTTLSLTTSWARYAVAGPISGGQQDCQLILFASIAGSPATATCFAWLPQLEAGSVATPSSPISTAAAGVTRAADVASITFTGGSSVVVTYGGGLIARPAATSPLNLGASSGGAWVGSYIESVVIR